MNSAEVCPFCGKSFKRLKVHLPHCKAVDRSKTPIQRDVTVSQKTSLLSPSSSQPTSPLSTAKKGKKSASGSSSTATQVKKTKKASSLSASPPPSQSASQPTAPTPLKEMLISSSSQPPSLCPSTPSSTGSVLPPTTKKKKQKLADQIKMATLSSSSPDSLSSSSPPPIPSLFKPKKKSLRALIEASRSNQVPERALEGTKSTSVDLLLVSTPHSLETDSITSRASALTGSQTGPDADNSKTAPVSIDPKSKGPPRKKGSLKEKAGPSLSITKASTVSQDSEGVGGGNGTRPNSRVSFWEDNEEDLSGRERSKGPGSGHLARVTLQDVKATLGRSNTSNQAGKLSILDQIQMAPIQTADSLTSKTKTKGPLTVNINQTPLPTQNRNEHVASLLLTSVAQSDQSADTRPQATELSMVNTESTEKMKSKQASLFPPQNEGLTQPKTTLLPSPVSPPLSNPPSSLVAPSAPLRNMVRLEEGLNVGYHKVGLLSASPSIAKLMEGGAPPCISSSSPRPHPHPLPLPNLPVGAGTVRANDRLMLEKPRLDIRKPHIAEKGIGGTLTDRSLGQVRLRELPDWLALKTPSHPKEAVELLQRGWQWYYRKYIDVKKGGVGGVAMLLAGYCVLSYIWSYPHIKRDRWRKYH